MIKRVDIKNIAYTLLARTKSRGLYLFV